jgi:hypothetical protein
MTQSGREEGKELMAGRSIVVVVVGVVGGGGEESGSRLTNCIGR